MKEEIVFNTRINEEDVHKINESAPITIKIKNTIGQSPKILRMLSEKVSIRITGGLDEEISPKYGDGLYYLRTVYTPSEVADIVENLEKLEEEINPKWTDLEKATFIYIYFLRRIQNQDDPKLGHDKNIDVSENLRAILEEKASSSGFALLFKEEMDRLGVPCKIFDNGQDHFWNELLIDDRFYPLDLSMDARDNKQFLTDGKFELKYYLSDPKFYQEDLHQPDNKEQQDRLATNALDYTKIQEAINHVLDHKELENKKTQKKELPVIPIKSKELKGIFKGDVVSEKTEISSEQGLKINLTDSNTQELTEDLRVIGTYYPEILSYVVLANDTTEHIDLQTTVDTIYQAQQETLKSTGYLNVSKISIESDKPEDFDLDFSNAPAVKQDPEHLTDDQEQGTTISFSSKSGTVKLPNINDKLSDNITTIEFINCDVSGFNIQPKNVDRNRKVPAKRHITLKGHGTQGISDLGGLDSIIKLTIANIPDQEFQDVMNIAIVDSPQMTNLFELNVEGQPLAGTDFLDRIKNKNIAHLVINKCGLDSIRGIENLKNQLVMLGLISNQLTDQDIRRICEIASNENLNLRICLFHNTPMINKVNTLQPMSDASYQYINELLQKTGWYQFRKYDYDRQSTLDDKKRELAHTLLKWDTKDIPYFIEDAQYFREELGYVCNPIMVKDLQTFQNLLNDPNQYFAQNYLRDATLLLSLEQLEYLIQSGKTIPQRISLKINVVSELSTTKLTDLQRQCSQKNLRLETVRIIDDRIKTSSNGDYRNIDCNFNNISPYTLQQYQEIRGKLDEVVMGIDPNLPEVEKFAIIYQRLSKLIYEYDIPAHGESYGKNHAKYQAELFNYSRNLYEGLVEREGFNLLQDTNNGELKYRSVCSGYADILKNALSLIGVESTIDHGFIEYNGSSYTGGHSWNKVKINGKWYFADLCWDRGEIVNSKERKKDQFKYHYALRGEREFSPTVTPGQRADGHLSSCDPNYRDEQMEQDDYDQDRLRDIFERTKNHPTTPPYTIDIPDDPDLRVPDLDIDRIKDEYKAKKADMYAKYYGDKDYQARYEEISARYRANEVEVTQGGITYRTIQDYAEKADDEAFLILEDYKEALERSTKYEAGDTSVYTGTPDEVQAKYESDKEYVDTRNYTFDQNKNTQKDLATLGKYGEKMPYIQRQQGVLKNILRGVGNAAIFARNLVAPIYRLVGRTVAQPLHRLRTRGRDASPYKNNPYHRFVARRDYFNDMAVQQALDQGTKIHPFLNMIMSNIRSITKYQEGNEAVLKAGAYDIQENLKEQETHRVLGEFLTSRKTELEQQITTLEQEIQAHLNATNIQEAQAQLAQKRNLLITVNANLDRLQQREKIRDIQTDAVSQTQHDIASKEFNTYKVAVIKGVAKIGVKKFVGPPLKKWLLEHSKKLISHEVPYQEQVVSRKFIEGTKETVPITELQPDYDIGIDGLMEKARGKAVRLFRSVSGGNKGEISYTIQGDEICTGLHFQNGTKWGTGFSNNVPLMTDQSWPEALVDAAGNLRQNVKFSEIAQAITNGELTEEMLGNLTVQVAGKGWVYANELFDGVTKSVNVGEEVIEHAGHWEDVVEIVDKVKTVTEYVDNPRVVNALNVLGHGARAAGRIDGVHNIAEMARVTKSDVRSNKKVQRAYHYDDSEYYR